MESIKIEGHIDNTYRLSVEVPGTFPIGPVTVVITPAPWDDTESAWMTGIAREWREELSDPAQDTYSLKDGTPVDESP